MRTVSYFLATIIFFLLAAHPSTLFAARPAVVAESVLAYTNAERYREGLSFLASNAELSKVARNKMIDLFAHQYFAHESLTGETVSDLAKKEGYEYIIVGENLALGNFYSSRDVVAAWMDSPGHRKNILSEAYSDIGIAAGKGMYDGRLTWIVVQSFGLPKSSCPTIDRELEEELKKLDQRLTLLKTIAEMRETAALRTDLTKNELLTSVELYNTAARLFNENIERYRELVEEYNDSVGEYNECVMDVREKIGEV